MKQHCKLCSGKQGKRCQKQVCRPVLSLAGSPRSVSLSVKASSCTLANGAARIWCPGSLSWPWLLLAMASAHRRSENSVKVLGSVRTLPRQRQHPMSPLLVPRHRCVLAASDFLHLGLGMRWCQSIWISFMTAPRGGAEGGRDALSFFECLK